MQSTAAMGVVGNDGCARQPAFTAFGLLKWSAVAATEFDLVFLTDTDVDLNPRLSDAASLRGAWTLGASLLLRERGVQLVATQVGPRDACVPAHACMPAHACIH